MNNIVNRQREKAGVYHPLIRDTQQHHIKIYIGVEPFGVSPADTRIGAMHNQAPRGIGQRWQKRGGRYARNQKHAPQPEYLSPMTPMRTTRWTRQALRIDMMDKLTLDHMPTLRRSLAHRGHPFGADALRLPCAFRRFLKFSRNQGSLMSQTGISQIPITGDTYA